MFDKKRGLAHLGLGLLICGACACEQNQQPAKAIDLSVDGFDGLSPTHFDLLATGCTITKAAAAVGTTPAVLGSVQFTLADGETLYLFERLADGQVVANAGIDATATECAFPTTYKINVASDVGDTSVHKVFLDFNYGSFGMATAAYNAKTPAGTGPNIVLALTGATNTLLVRGTSHPDIFTFGSVTTGTGQAAVTTTYGSFAFGSLVTPKTGPAVETAPTARAFPDLSATGLTNITVSTGSGNDVITGQGGLPIGQKAGIGILDGTISITVYGGAGDDIITSGGASTAGALNKLYGNCGNDTFLQQLALATDVITGSNASGCTDTADTVDYSIRVNPLAVTLGDSNYLTASNATILCSKKSLLVNNDGFTVNDGTHTAQFEYQVTAAATYASGSIKVAALPVDGTDFTLSDGVTGHAAVPFVYAVTMGASAYFDSTSTTSNIIDVFTGTPCATVACVAAATAVAINNYQNAHAATFKINAAAPSATAPGLGLDTTVLANSVAAVASNVPITSTNATGKLTLAGMTGGAAGFIATGGKKTISLLGGTTASYVATQTAAAILLEANGLTDGSHHATVTAIANGPLVTVSFPQLAGINVAKPAGAALNAKTGVFTITDFSAQAAPTATGNDGEVDPISHLSLEFDDLDVSIQNIVGGAGNDTIDTTLSSHSNHILYGMSGDDTLIGSDLNDTLYGGWGNDSLFGGKGNDLLVGGDGNDTLQGGAANDVIKGDDINCPLATVMAAGSSYATLCSKTTAPASTVKVGVNTLDYADHGKDVTVDMSTLTNASLNATSGLPECSSGNIGESGECDLVTAVQNLRGGMGNDTLTGDTNANVIYGGIGDDTLSGGTGGSDAIYGESGDDTIDNHLNTSAMGSVLSGGTGTNVITSGTGANFIDDSQGKNSTITCSSADDVVMTGITPTTTGCGLSVH
jgi:Ca2+-binding RTX toxin-like protein